MYRITPIYWATPKQKHIYTHVQKNNINLIEAAGWIRSERVCEAGRRDRVPDKNIENAYDTYISGQPRD